MNPFIAKDDGKYVLFSITFAVVPYVGTWIEIYTNTKIQASASVVPYVGTWIEISAGCPWMTCGHGSFPTWERG